MLRLIPFCFLIPSVASAASLQPETLSLIWAIPFIAILLSIALCPLFLPRLWHHHFGKITALWTLLFLIPFAISFGLNTATYVVAHAVIEEYIPFILLLIALYTVSGGIYLRGNLAGTPWVNTSILGLGTVLASLMGTTGAAMLLIRPLLRANENRRHRVHTIVFFIFLVANIGGGLTPLGDPPLFLGFLKGVDFLWTVKHMLLPVFVSAVTLLTVYYLLDRHFYSKTDERLPVDSHEDDKLRVYGKINLLLLIAVVAVVLMSGLWKPNVNYTFLGISIGLETVTRDLLLLVIAVLSLVLTPKQVRSGNEFNWGPMLEVGKLFLGIFITIAPVLAMLKAGESGAFRSIVGLVRDDSGAPIDVMYFWMSGMLSAFLDNAPTYLVFFNLASGDAAHLMANMPSTLLAVSMGSVFMGALSYIGNAPNFMVKAMAESRKVQMPGFFGYMMWSFGILVPLFFGLTLLFFV